MTGGDHDVLDGVDRHEPLAVHPEQAVTGGFQLDLALLDLAAGHMVVLTQGQQPLRRVVFVDHAGRHLPDIEMLLAHGEQDRDVLLRDHMALAEPGVLVLVLDDLGQVVAQHVAHSFFRTNQFHLAASRISI